MLHLLYHVAIRCRVARTRGRALALLQRAQARREGVWDGAATALVAGRAIALEEQARRPVGGMAEPGPGGGCILAEARVTAIWTETDLENRRVVLRYERQGGTACSEEEVLTW